jgi:TRAP-type C4-dicarboxylate transport system substrate-binding protein
MNRRQCAALVAGLALARPGSAQDRAVVRWKLATGYRAETFHGRNLAQFAAEAAQATQGALAIELHANGALYKLADIWPACEQGQLDAGETIMTSLVKALPIAGADSVPFVVGSYEDARRMWRHQRPLIERQFAARGLEVLYAVPWPPQGLFSTRPVSVSADLKGTRMRTYNQTTVRIAQLLGAVPVDVPMVDVARALAAGRVDTMITSAVTDVENQVWSHVRHYYEINAWFPKNVVFVRQAAMQALDAARQQAVRRAALAAEARGWQASMAAALESVEELRRRGMKVERVSPEFDKEIKRLGERFSLEWIRDVGREANEIFVPYYTQQ